MFLSKAIVAVEPASWEGSMLVVWNHLKLAGWGLRPPEFVQQWCASAQSWLIWCRKNDTDPLELGGASHIHPKPSHPLSKSLRIPSELWCSWAIAAAYAWGAVDVLPKIPKRLVNWIMAMVHIEVAWRKRVRKYWVLDQPALPKGWNIKILYPKTLPTTSAGAGKTICFRMTGW